VGIARITCLLGAGAAVEIGGPTTDALTKLIDENWEKAGLGNIANTLQGNFEEKFHALEMLYSYKMSRRNTLNGYIAVKKEFINWEYIKACNLLLETIGERIYEYSKVESMRSLELWFYDFWRDFAGMTALDVITLNYDTCVEQCLRQYEDGFSEEIAVMGISSNCAYRFNPKTLDETGSTRVMHLHGCINYANGLTRDVNQYCYDDDFHDLYKYKTYEAARENWWGHSTPYAQDGVDIHVGPIITGLRKADKILVNPYMSYDYEFHKALINNSSLLLIGYSCGDRHINAKLLRMKQLHGNRRRVVIISFLPNSVREKWHPDPYIRKWPTEGEYEVLSHLMGCEVAALLEQVSCPKSDCIVSEDGCVRWCLCGFKKTVSEYKKEIFTFLLG
jgi:hypothetical protein